MNRQQRRANRGRLEKGLPLVLSAPKPNCRSAKANVEKAARNFSGNPRHHRFAVSWASEVAAMADTSKQNAEPPKGSGVPPTYHTTPGDNQTATKGIDR